MSPRLALLLLALLAAPARAEFSRYLALQGRLEDPPGTPVTGTEDVTFRLYAVSSGGSPLTSETDAVSFDEAGLFAATLGDGDPLDPALFGQDLWVGVTVDEAGGGSELSPRIPLVAAPYAHEAAAARELLTTGSEGQFLRHDGSGWAASDSLGQELTGVTTSGTQDIAHDAGGLHALTGTTQAYAAPANLGASGSAVMILGSATLNCQTLTGLAVGGAGGTLVLQRDTDPGFSGATFVASQNFGFCWLRAHDGTQAEVVNQDTGATLVHLETGLTPGQTYYYRLAFFAGGGPLNGGNFTITQAKLNVLQVQR